MFISENNGASWTALEGKYTTSGSQYQDPGNPVYDGTKDWVQEEIDLSEFAGSQVKFRFKLRSDSYVTGDGFYFDDFVISVISMVTSIQNATEESMFVSEAFPNPGRNIFKVQYSLEKNHQAALELFDAVGNHIKTIPVREEKGVLSVPVSQLKAGIYYYRLVNGNKVSKTLKFVKM